MAPVPVAAPSKVLFMAGSSASQGDHSTHLWKSATIPYGTSGGAATVMERWRANVAGRGATTMRKTTTRRTKTSPIFLSMGDLHRGVGERAILYPSNEFSTRAGRGILS